MLISPQTAFKFSPDRKCLCLATNMTPLTFDLSLLTGHEYHVHLLSFRIFTGYLLLGLVETLPLRFGWCYSFASRLSVCK